MKHMKQTIAIVGIVGAIAAVMRAQTERDAGANWPLPLGGPGATRYSTLTQINSSNVSQLKRAWTFHTQSGRFSGAPMVVDSVMYFSANNGVFALDAVTGTQIWKYVPDASQVRSPRPEGARLISAAPAKTAATAGPVMSARGFAGRPTGPGRVASGRGFIRPSGREMRACTPLMRRPASS